MAETRDTRDGTGYVASDCAGPIRACRVCSATTTLQECATLCGAPFCRWGRACDGSISARFSPTVRYTSMNCSPWLTAPARKCMGDERSIAKVVGAKRARREFTTVQVEYGGATSSCRSSQALPKPICVAVRNDWRILWHSAGWLEDAPLPTDMPDRTSSINLEA